MILKQPLFLLWNKLKERKELRRQAIIKLIEKRTEINDTLKIEDPFLC